MPSKGKTKDYSLAELMAVLAAKEIKDGDKVFVGIGIPMIAGFLAIHSHAPNAVLMFEGGYLGSHPPVACTDVGDSVLGLGAPYVTSSWRTFSDLQHGYCDIGIIGSAPSRQVRQRQFNRNSGQRHLRESQGSTARQRRSE